MNSNTGNDNDELRAWYKSELDSVVKKMIKNGTVTGAAVEATPVWAVPNEILIAKVWSAAQKSQFVWTISGSGAILDSVAGSVATNPRDAAKHFALKWQLNAEQIVRAAKNTPMTLDSQGKLEAKAQEIIKYAESLFDLSARDDIWS